MPSAEGPEQSTEDAVGGGASFGSGGVGGPLYKGTSCITQPEELVKS